MADAFHAEHRALYGYDFSGDADPAGRVGEPPGLRHRADHAARRSSAGRPTVLDDGASAPPRPADDAGRSASTPTTGTSTRRCVRRTDLAPGTASTGPAIIEEFGSTVPSTRASTVRVDEYLNLIVTRSEA